MIGKSNDFFVPSDGSTLCPTKKPFALELFMPLCTFYDNKTSALIN